MTYVIAGSCIKDDSCIEVCPVDCIHPKPGAPDFETAEQLYIDPELCIDCDACVEACPVDAIFADFEIPEKFKHTLELNAEFFAEASTVERPRAWWRVREWRSWAQVPPGRSRRTGCCDGAGTRRSTCSSGCRRPGGCSAAGSRRTTRR